MLSIKSGFFFGAEKFGSRSDDKSPKISKMGPILISIIFIVWFSLTQALGW